MAARDQALFLETFLGLQRALKRKSYDSDSDSEIDQTTNRGNKLKKRARFVREGQLVPSDGSNVFAEAIDYNGYQREIISHNPPVVDEDGYEVDESEDDEEDVQEAIASAAEKNPYSSIHLETLLAPLTSVTDLATHPTLSRPYKSTVLAELATQGRNWMHKENKALWKVKPLLTKFSGDHIWVDCQLMSTPDDIKVFDDKFTSLLAVAQAHSDSLVRPEDFPKLLTQGGEPKTNGAADTAMPDANSDKEEAKKEKEEPQEKGKQNGGEKALINGTAAVAAAAAAAASGALTTVSTPTSVVAPFPDPDENDAVDDGHGGYIHPLYLAPRAARPYPNVGLPDNEAEDVRRLLQLWVQKQEEVARGARKLQEGLLKANRLRKTVFFWAKAEANKDLSDGEDYYDKEQWGLKEDLKKGHDEEEEEQVPVKKTRNRK